ncbi:MAG: PKD domain-containing protein, partial [Thermoanaerobaculia bacterium]
TMTYPQRVFVDNGSGTQVKIDFSVSAWPGVPNGYQFTAISTPAGSITQWHFDFGDGNSSSNATAHNVYADANDHTVTLTSPQLPGVTATHKLHDAPPVPPRRRASRH